MSCSNNLKQLGLAIHNYHDTSNAIPPLRNRDTALPDVDSWNTMTVSWRGRILPYIEQSTLYDNVDFSVPQWWSGTYRPNTNWEIVKHTVVPAFRCPTDPGNGSVNWTDPSGNVRQGHPTSSSYATTNYFGCTGPDSQVRWNGVGLGFFDGISSSAGSRGGVKRFRDVTDGLSSTIALAEGVIGHPRQNVNPNDGSTVSGNYQTQAATYTATDNGCPIPGSPSTSSTNARGNSWFRGYSANDLSFNTVMAPNSDLWDCHANTGWGMYASRSLHPGGVQVTVADGSVRFVSETIDLAQWRALGGTSDGVVASFDE